MSYFRLLILFSSKLFQEKFFFFLRIAFPGNVDWLFWNPIMHVVTVVFVS